MGSGKGSLSICYTIVPFFTFHIRVIALRIVICLAITEHEGFCLKIQPPTFLAILTSVSTHNDPLSCTGYGVTTACQSCMDHLV